MWKADTNINFYENLLEQKENGQIKAIEFNFSTICLLCLKNLVKKKTLKHLLHTEINIAMEMFQLNVSSSSNVIMIKEMLLNIMGNHVDFNGDFPQQICLNCLDYLKKSYFFKRQTLKTQNILKKLLSVSGKSDQNEPNYEIERKSIDVQKSFIVQDETIKMEKAEKNDIVAVVELPIRIDNELKFTNRQLDENDHQKVKKIKINKFENDEVNKFNNVEKSTVEVEYLEYNNSFDDDESENENIFIENSNIELDFIEDGVNESDNDKLNMEQGFQEEEFLSDHSTIKLPISCKSDIKIESIFKCPGCETILKSKNNLRSHITIHHPNSKYFNCDGCDISFRTLQSLERHIKCHQNNVERKMCSYCSKSFLRADDLRRHVRIHTNERPFHCKWPLCNKSFKQSSELSTHQSVHLKTEFKCNLCDKIFRSRYGIYVHKKTHIRK